MAHGSARRDQPWPIRLSHWANVPLGVVLAGSGLQILVAYPYLGPRGAPYGWYPLQGFRPPQWLRLGDWLAGARALHFAFAWLFVANGLVYLAYVLATGEWRRRVFLPRRDLGGALQTARFYLRLRGDEPAHGFYNGLQRLAYTTALALGLLLVLSGLVLYEPVQLHRLTWLLGGYDSARAIHLLALAAIGLFTLGHVFEVLRHPRTLVAMLQGGAKRDPLDR